MSDIAELAWLELTEKLVSSLPKPENKCKALI